MEASKFEKFSITVLGMCAGMFIYRTVVNPIKYIPKVDKLQVQQGYVIPSKLEIECKDLDGRDGKETIMNYDGRSYLLKLDEQGNPVIQAYEVKPAEIKVVPAEAVEKE